MTLLPLIRMPFNRGQERRKSALFVPRDQRINERRSLTIGWLPLFREVDESAINVALIEAEVLLLPAGAALLKPGETNDNVYILLSGEIAAYLDNNLSPFSTIGIFAGECIGELSAIDGKPVSALIKAITDARLLLLPKEMFWYRIMAIPGVARNVMISLTERMRRSSEQMLKAQREQLELLHLRKELDVARQLQASMLPPQRPLFTERNDIEVCGFMEPASVIGGDLFDAFFVDEQHLFFCIGDVSGHGIAAALFMARTIGLLRLLAIDPAHPDTLLETLNDRLCIGNDVNIFVTLFCGFLNVQSGQLIYSNGGQCAPILCYEDQAVQLALPKGALIGAFAGIKYSSMEYFMRPEESLFCYTDGLTEAQNAVGAEFSEERCLKSVHQASQLSLPIILNTLRTEVINYIGTDVLQDDCTMIILRRPVLILN